MTNTGLENSLISQLLTRVLALSCDSARTLECYSLVFTMDEIEIFQGNHHNSTAVLYLYCKGSYGNRRIHKDGDGDALFQLKSNSFHQAQAIFYKDIYKIRFKNMKAQELRQRLPRNSDIQDLPLKIIKSIKGDFLAKLSR
ncbi:hypothetical protein Tco_1321515 [Tanacetum coccineum]